MAHSPGMNCYAQVSAVRDREMLLNEVSGRRGRGRGERGGRGRREEGGRRGGGRSGQISAV